MLVSVVGLGLLVLGAREAAGLRARLSPAGLLIGARSVVAAPDGSFFVGSDLARVHVYSPQGRPLRGFLVPVERFDLRMAPPDRLWVLPEADTPPLAFDLEGNSVETTQAVPGPAPGPLRIRDGDVVRTGTEGERVLVRGYESHVNMLVHTLVVGLALFSGGGLLLGGMLATGRRSDR